MSKSFWQFLTVAVFLGLFSSPFTFADNTVYKWTDEDGGTHYGARPPKGKQSSAIKPKTGHSEPVDYTHFSGDTPKEAVQTKNATNTDSAAKDPERCEAAKSNLEILSRGGRVRAPVEDGSFIYLDEEQIADRIEQAQRAVDESC